MEKSASTAVVETLEVPEAENRPNFFKELGNLVPKNIQRYNKIVIAGCQLIGNLRTWKFPDLFFGKQIFKINITVDSCFRSSTNSSFFKFQIIQSPFNTCF
jgi:hypothetical protein